MNEPATEECGYLVMQCRIGCDAELETIANEDGTSETVKVEDTDTCQRFGEFEMFCDMQSHMCKEYAAEEPVVDPTDPEPVVEPTDGANTEVKCCYDPQNLQGGLYGVFSYSTSTPTNPEGWQQSPDLDIKNDGCFSFLVDMGLVYKGFWVDMTREIYPDDDTEIPDDFWVGEAAKPTTCYVAGKKVGVGKFDAGWELGQAADRQ
jgi:hypothetical protein